MLTIITGKHGSGKTTLIIEKIQSYAEKKVRCIVLVPEQYTVDYEKTVLSALSEDIQRYVEITNFKRLCHNIFCLYGGISDNYLEDSSKIIIMAKALKAYEDRIELFKNTVNEVGFLEKLVELKEECDREKITPDLLLDASEKAFGIQQKKLKEISEIFAIYDALLYEKYTDAHNDFESATDKVIANRPFENDCIFLDSFESFSKEELDFLDAVFRRTKDIFASICIDENDKSARRFIFDEAKKTIGKLNYLAQKNNHSVKTIKAQYESSQNKDIAFLKDNLLDVTQVYDGVCENISLYTAKNLFSETEYVAATIQRLIKQGYKYSDIIVIMRDTDEYSGIIESTFDKYNVPAYINKKTDFLTKPLALFILNLIEMSIYGIEYDLLFSYLKTGLSQIPQDDVALLENYASLWGITGKKWYSDWNMSIYGYVDRELSEEDKLQNVKTLEKINEIRKKVIIPIDTFIKKVNNETVEKICKLIYEHIEAVNVKRGIVDSSEIFIKTNQTKLLKEQQQIYDICIDALDQLALIYKNEKTNIKNFYEILKIILRKSKIKTIPSSLDEVLVTSADRISSFNKKICFILGVNDGHFPLAFKDTGLINDMDIKLLESMDLSFSKTTEMKTYYEQTIMYNSICAANEKLYMSCINVGSDQKERQPSYIFEHIKNMFNLKPLKEGDLDKFYFIQSQKSAFQFMCKNLDNENMDLKSFYEYFEADEEYRQKLERAKLLKNFGNDERIDKEYAEKLFSKEMKISPSKAEIYFKCPYQYFLQYGLKIKESKKAKLDPQTSGSFVHRALEVVVKKIFEENDDLISLSDEVLYKLSEEISYEYMESVFGGSEGKTNRFLYLYRNLIKTVFQLLLRIKKEFENSSFRPCDYELEIEKDGQIKPVEILLDNDRKIYVCGTADRVDVYRRDGYTYIRVVDYKTGKKIFNLNDVLNGLNMQMLIYLFTIIKNGGIRYGEKLIPAGVLYFPAQDPVISLDRKFDVAQLEELRQQKQNGLVLDDEIVIKAMDNSLEYNLKSKIIPVEYKKDNTLAAKSSVASIAELGKIERQIETLLKKMAQNLAEGKIEITPFKDKHCDSCKFCSMASICGFEQSRNKPKKYQIYKEEEV